MIFNWLEMLQSDLSRPTKQYSSRPAWLMLVLKGTVYVTVGLQILAEHVVEQSSVPMTTCRNAVAQPVKLGCPGVEVGSPLFHGGHFKCGVTNLLFGIHFFSLQPYGRGHGGWGHLQGLISQPPPPPLLQLCH